MRCIVVMESIQHVQILEGSMLARAGGHWEG